MDGSRSVALTTLLDRIKPEHISGDRRVDVSAIEIDSANVRPGAIFVALRGAHTDGHRFVHEAVANGARVVVVEEALAEVLPNVTVVRVGDSRRALSQLAARFFGEPSQALDVIGVTGTNGKTTVVHMIAAVLDAAAIPCGIVGTVGAEFGSVHRPVENTTPLPPALHALLAEMRGAGARAVAMEVSSHALALGRVDDVRFRVAVLTNVARDHLDFHETLDSYAAAKRRLFSMAPACILNVDDSIGLAWVRDLERERRTVVSYGAAQGATLVPSDIFVTPGSTSFTVDGQRYELRLLGRFNVWNALAALGVARLFEIDPATAARGLAGLEHVPGRMQRIAGGDVAVIVDYAHTPDALENALRSLRETVSGRLTVVFGCGGDRDRGKRPEMGAVAARLADRIYVTSDNPRSESPRAIADAVLSGIGSAEYVVELDRRLAIERAIAEAGSADLVLVAGKGHEPYQIVGDRITPFDDAAIAREALAARTSLR